MGKIFLKGDFGVCLSAPGMCPSLSDFCTTLMDILIVRLTYLLQCSLGLDLRIVLSINSVTPISQRALLHCRRRYGLTAITPPTLAKTRQGQNNSQRNSCRCISNTLMHLHQCRLHCLKFSTRQNSHCCESSLRARYIHQQALLRWSGISRKVDCC